MALNTKTRGAVAGWLFLMPNLLGFLLFTSVPVLASLVLSFYKWDLFTPARFVGLQNFVRLLGFHAGRPNDPEFWSACFNTVFLMLMIPVNMLASLFLALVMNQKLRGIVAFRTMFFLPTIVAGVGTYLLWKWMFNPDYGMINSFLVHGLPGPLNAALRRLLGQWPPHWLQSIGWAKPALMLMGFWVSAGGSNMVLYLAALQNVPPDLYEAAQIDGAGRWRKFLHITWPMVGPTTFFIFTMSLIGGFQGGFEQAMVMTGGGPAGATTTVGYYIYNHAFQWNHMGYAAAIAWVLFAAIFTATLLQWRWAGRAAHF